MLLEETKLGISALTLARFWYCVLRRAAPSPNESIPNFLACETTATPTPFTGAPAGSEVEPHKQVLRWKPNTARITVPMATSSPQVAGPHMLDRFTAPMMRRRPQMSRHRTRQHSRNGRKILENLRTRGNMYQDGWDLTTNELMRIYASEIAPNASVASQSREQAKHRRHRVPRRFDAYAPQ